MKCEIEVKLPVHDLPATLRRLRAIGGIRTARVFEQNTLFDTPDGHFRKRRSMLRIRIQQKAARWGSPKRRERPKTACDGLLTFKCPVKIARRAGRAAQNCYKERSEVEYHLPDARRFALLLKRLGLVRWFQYEKYRSRYCIDGSALHIDLDETPIGTFLELEGSRRSIDRTAKALGYSARDYITASYLELYAAECARKGVPVANMVFSAKKNAN